MPSLPQHLYVHVPFCARRCSYCDFSIAVRSTVPVADYLDGVRRELSGIVGSASSRRDLWTLDTLYLGGGTPSRLGGEGIRDLIRLISEFATIVPDAEVTIEANPDDVVADAVAHWTAAGVNRVSLGAQSFSDTVLDWMHRTHNAGQIANAVGIIRAAGIVNLSLDLIFALPPEVERSWANDLDAAIALEPDHISLYGLTVEPATPLQRWTSAGRVSPAAEDRYAEEFLHAHNRMTGEGFTHYEVSNFARPGRRSRHNSAYWTGTEYLGVGPAAHSFGARHRRWNVKAYAEWLRILRAGGSVIAGEELIDSENAVTEGVYLGLRTLSGYQVGESDRAAAEQWTKAGWAVIDGDFVRLNPEGWLRLDSLAAGLTGS
ncbi:MAG: radical SAM family heme chaperone HemW [Gemmatimonadales bacterium]